MINMIKMTNVANMKNIENMLYKHQKHANMIQDKNKNISNMPNLTILCYIIGSVFWGSYQYVLFNENPWYSLQFKAKIKIFLPTSNIPKKEENGWIFQNCKTLFLHCASHVLVSCILNIWAEVTLSEIDDLLFKKSTQDTCASWTKGPEFL